MKHQHSWKVYLTYQAAWQKLLYMYNGCINYVRIRSKSTLLCKYECTRICLCDNGAEVYQPLTTVQKVRFLSILLYLSTFTSML